MFLKSAGEIKDIVEICKENGIEITGSMFLKSAEEIKDIVEVCKENGIEITGSVFYKSAETLKNNVIYIKENYGSKYITNLTVSKNYNNLVETLPYLKENGWLDVIINSASILSLTLDEIKQRELFIKSIGEEVVVENKKTGKKFNPIFGLARNRYKKRVDMEKVTDKKTEKSLARAIVSNETLELKDEAAEFLNSITKENQIEGDETR